LQRLKAKPDDFYRYLWVLLWPQQSFDLGSWVQPVCIRWISEERSCWCWNGVGVISDSPGQKGGWGGAWSQRSYFRNRSHCSSQRCISCESVQSTHRVWNFLRANHPTARGEHYLLW
jgi:hypothetical protein